MGAIPLSLTERTWALFTLGMGRAGFGSQGKTSGVSKPVMHLRKTSCTRRELLEPQVTTVLLWEPGDHPEANPRYQAGAYRHLQGSYKS
jgi:hypothetical protein